MPRNLSLMLFDIDWDQAMPKHFKLNTAEDVWNTLVTLFPLLAYVSMLIRPSSSAGIYNTVTSAVRSLVNSWHIYIIVYNSTTETNKNFVEFLKRRAWLPSVNLAYAKLTGTGVCERYYMDLAVHSAERLIVESDPILESPLAKSHIASGIFKGGALDLASIDNSLETDYREVYAHEKAKLLIDTPILNDGNASNRVRTTMLSIPKPFSLSKAVYITVSTQEAIKMVYLFFQENNRASTGDFKKLMTDEVTKAVLIFLGYEVDYGFKFKIRDERTASASISHTGLIKDFGGDFTGSIIDFLIKIYNLAFKESWVYIKNLFGMYVPFPRPFPSSLPNPRSFEKCLIIPTNNLIGQTNDYK